MSTPERIYLQVGYSGINIEYVRTDLYDEVRERLDGYECSVLSDRKRRTERLEAENERLRAAIRDFCEHCPHCHGTGNDTTGYGGTGQPTVLDPCRICSRLRAATERESNG